MNLIKNCNGARIIISPFGREWGGGGVGVYRVYGLI